MRFPFLLGALSILLLATGCNALIDIEQRHPLEREVDLNDPDMNENPPDMNENPSGNPNSVNNGAGQSCDEIIQESYPDYGISADGEVCRMDGELLQECLAEYELCLRERGELTCEEAFTVLLDFSEGAELTQQNFFELCLEYGGMWDQRFDDQTCSRLTSVCF